MRRLAFLLPLCLLIAPAFSQAQPSTVQLLGDMSFAVPEGWTYSGSPAGGMMTLKAGTNYWMMAVFTPMPSSGNAEVDLLTAWNTLVLSQGGYQGAPLKPYFDIAHTVGYPGKRADGTSMNRAQYTRLYVLETGKTFIPVRCISNDGLVLNSQEYIANALLGSIRLSPAKAEPIKTSITVADMVGHWTSGAGSSLSFYSTSTGQYQGTSNSFYGAGYTIAADGSFTYKMSGMVNNGITHDDDSGVVQFEPQFVVFKGHNHVVRYRFLNIQKAIDGSTVMTFLPPAANPATLSIIRDGEPWVRAPRK